MFERVTRAGISALVFISLALASTLATAQENPVQKYLVIGNAAAMAADYDAAIAAYTKVLEADNGYLGALHNRGNAYREKGEYSKALADYVQVLQAAPPEYFATGSYADARRRPQRPFLFAIEDVLYINGVGTVATGEVVRGEVKAGEEIEIVGARLTRKATIIRMDKGRQSVDGAKVDEKVGIILRGIGKDEVKRGEVLAAPGSMAPYTEFEAEIYLLAKDKGGRSTPVFKGYRPQFFFRTSVVSGSVIEIVGAETAEPGQRHRFKVQLVESAAIEEGLLFAIREGGRTVGMGVVATVVM